MWYQGIYVYDYGSLFVVVVVEKMTLRDIRNLCGGKKTFLWEEKKLYWSRCRRYYYYSPLESSAALIFFSPHPTKLRRTLYLLFLDSEVFLCPVYLPFYASLGMFAI